MGDHSSREYIDHVRVTQSKYMPRPNNSGPPILVLFKDIIARNLYFSIVILFRLDAYCGRPVIRIPDNMDIVCRTNFLYLYRAQESTPPPEAEFFPAANRSFDCKITPKCCLGILAYSLSEL